MEAKLIIRVKDMAGSTLGRLAARVKGLDSPVKKLRGSFSSFNQVIRLNNKEAERNVSRFQHLREGFQQLGGGTRDLTVVLGKLGLSAAAAGTSLVASMGRQTLAGIISSLKDFGRKLKSLSFDFKKFTQSLKDVCSSLKSFKDTSVQTFAKVTAAGAALVYGFKRLFVDIGINAEECGLRLSNALGDKALGAEALKNLRAFSSATGRELGEATSAFVSLSEGGIKPTIDNLNKVADMAAKKNKSLQETGEAFKRALKGEAGALEEWGVKSELVGKHMLYKYTDQNGQLIKLAAKISDPKATSALLNRLAQDKAAGAQKEQGNTFKGTFDKLLAKWAEFRAMVMDSGPWQFLRAELDNVLAWVERLEKNEGMKKLAQEWGGKLTRALKAVKEGLKEGWQWLQKWGPKGQELISRFGGMKAAALALGAVFGGPLVLSLGGVIKAVALLGRTIMFTPVGLLLTAGAAIAYVMNEAGVLVPFVEGLGQGFKELKEILGPSFDNIMTGVADLFGITGDKMGGANNNVNIELWREFGRVLAHVTNFPLKELVKTLERIVTLLNKLKELASITGPDLTRQKELAAKIEEAEQQGDNGEAQKLMKELAQENKRIEQAKITPTRGPMGKRYQAQKKTSEGEESPSFFMEKKRRESTFAFSHPLNAHPLIKREPKPAPEFPALAHNNIQPQNYSGPGMGGALSEFEALLKIKEKVEVTVKLEGQLPEGLKVSAKADTPGTKVDDRTRQLMGHQGNVI